MPGRFAEAEHLVWVYGSLMSTGCIRDALQPREVLPGRERQAVTGWRRSWSCLSAKTFRTASGVRVRRVVAGLEPAPGHTTEGILLHLDDQGMARIRQRELAYDETDITEHVQQPPGKVVTFIPKRARNRALATSDLPLLVERSYFESCIRGAAEHGLGAVVEELESALDLDLADAAGDIVWKPPP